MYADLPVQATGFLILFARVGAVLMLLPVFSEDAVPMRLRLMGALGMTAALWGLLSARVLPVAGNDAQLLGLVLVELGIGLALGMLVKLLFQAIIMAGAIISLQTGLSSALVFDASLGGQTPLLAKLIALAAVLFCMAMGLHHMWIAAIVRSYEFFPLGVVPDAGELARLAVATTGKAMMLAVSIAGPFLVYGIVFNVALGLSARLAPAIQIFFIAQPLNILIGIALLAVTMGAILTAFSASFAEWMSNGFA
ncbi:flagellar biosynthetic protein FliR [Sphingomonas changnyeongensis]|uniref:Flagellar biosynthetic protein FliR n=1 Tax=Sphingomonas changnyeongensis TaxID=2698679 RepID=A0A7Z2S474_9SPHN|nr:flagellar biosynthetic protein FliR [Sphingomonas changnyeongensis]QHL89760.1 flagellar biosynthetic protein FliR [Sphingomonas changnyeongensis]